MGEHRERLVVVGPEKDELVVEFPSSDDDARVLVSRDDTHVIVDPAEPPESHGLRRDFDDIAKVAAG